MIMVWPQTGFLYVSSSYPQALDFTSELSPFCIPFLQIEEKFFSFSETTSQTFYFLMMWVAKKIWKIWEQQR